MHARISRAQVSLLCLLVFVLLCAQRTFAQDAQQPYLIASNWQKYPGYAGDVDASMFEGYVKIERGSSATQLSISGKLTGLPNGTFGIHIHYGFDVTDEATVGGHFFPGLETNPWEQVTYRGPDWTIAPALVVDGVSFDSVRGRTMVVHDASAPVGIATLMPFDGTSTRVQAARIVPFADSLHLSASLNPYPESPSKGNGTIASESRVWVVAKEGGGLTVHYSLSGLVPSETSGGARVHTGTTCNSHTEIGGHLLKTDNQDPWGASAVWTKIAGETTASGSFDVDDDKTLGANDHRAFVIHQADGKGIACGVLRSSASAAIAAVASSGVSGHVWFSESDGALRVSLQLEGVDSAVMEGGVSVRAAKSCEDPGDEFRRPGAGSWAGVKWSRNANATNGPVTGFFDIDSGYSLADNTDHAVVVTGAGGAIIGCGLLQFYPAVTGFVQVDVDGESVRLRGNVAGLSSLPCQSTFGAPCKLGLGRPGSCAVAGAGGRYGETSFADAKHQQLLLPVGGKTAGGEDGVSGGASVDKVISPVALEEGTTPVVLVMAANGALVGCGEVEDMEVDLTADEFLELKPGEEEEEEEEEEDDEEEGEVDDIVLPEEPATSQDLINVVIVWGSFSLVLVLIFSAIRTRYDALYAPRKVVEDIQCELASDMFSFWTWAPRVLRISEEEIFEHCGFDGVALIRWLRVGLILALAASFNAIWLMPTYRTSPEREINANITDGLERLSMANVYANDPRMYGSVIAAYINTFLTFILVYKEFNWYIKERHLHLSKQTPQNYTILVGGIPPNLRSKFGLAKYFASIVGDEVLEVCFALHIKELEGLVSEREGVLAKLEHAKEVFESKGERPHHMTLRGKVDSIEAHEQQAEELKGQINAKIAEIESKQQQIEREAEADGDVSHSHSDHQGLLGADLAESPHFLRDAAFVSFKSLKPATQALQLLHHRTPFNLWAVQAPQPKDIYWGNIGAPHIRIQVTSILAGMLTVITCVLWTIPVSLVATLTKVEVLKQEVPFLKDASDNFPLMDDLLGVVAPVALILVTNLLPAILTKFCQMEGHVGEDMLQASLFSKLTFFMIVQVFFVSVIAGSIFNKINDLIDNPNEIITILAKSLPPQALTFMAYTLVKSTVELALELIRFWPWVYAGVRAVGGGVAEWWGYEPLSNPGNLDFATVQSDMILIYIVLYVYSVLAPVTSFVMALGFFLMGLVFKYQMIYVYDPSCDTGGKLWPQVAGYIIICLLISHFTIMGVMGLKSAAYSVPLMIPLIALTILFWRYLKQQHFRAALLLPQQLCLKQDSENERDGPLDYEFVLGAYKQEALAPIDAEGEQADDLAIPAGMGDAECLPDQPPMSRAEARAEHPEEPSGSEVPAEVAAAQNQRRASTASRDSDAPARLPPPPPPPRPASEAQREDTVVLGARWTCEACTLENDGSQAACSACGAAQPASASSPARALAAPDANSDSSVESSAEENEGIRAMSADESMARDDDDGTALASNDAAPQPGFGDGTAAPEAIAFDFPDQRPAAPQKPPPPPPPAKVPPPPPPRPNPQPPPSPQTPHAAGSDSSDDAAPDTFDAGPLDPVHPQDVAAAREVLSPMEVEKDSVVRRLESADKGPAGENLFFD